MHILLFVPANSSVAGGSLLWLGSLAQLELGQLPNAEHGGASMGTLKRSSHLGLV